MCSGDVRHAPFESRRRPHGDGGAGHLDECQAVHGVEVRYNQEQTKINN